MLELILSLAALSILIVIFALIIDRLWPIRQLFKDDRPKVSRRGDRATIWRIAPPAQQTSDNPLGNIDGDADFIRIYPSRRR